MTFKRVDDFVAGSLSDVVDRYCSGTWLQRGRQAVWANGSALVMF